MYINTSNPSNVKQEKKRGEIIPTDSQKREKKRMEIEAEDVVIVGGGISGLATALALKRVGISALVLERSDRLRDTGAAISLFPNAWFALKALGISKKLTSLYAPLGK